MAKNSTFCLVSFHSSIRFSETYPKCGDNHYDYKISTVSSDKTLIRVPRGLLVLKNAPKMPILAKNDTFDPQLWIFLFNVSKILQNQAILSVKYELSIHCLSKFLI